jgi:hypothetical protein
VLGHLQAYGGVQEAAGLDGASYGRNVGCLIDVEAVAFAYARQLAQRPTLGSGVIVEGVPHFEPLR